MAPLPISLEARNPVSMGGGYNFPPPPSVGGGAIPRAHPHPPPIPVGAPDVDDVFVIIVSLAVVATLLAFVLLQAVAALKELLEQRSSPFCALPISTFRKHGLLSLNSKPSEHERLLMAPSSESVDTNGYRYSRWVPGPNHRCQFTLSPERYDSDTSSTLTRSYSSDSTVVGGRICVVYDDTIEASDDENEDEDENSGEEEEEEEEDEDDAGECDQRQRRRGLGYDGKDRGVPLRPVHEPRPRVRREALFIQ